MSGFEIVGVVLGTIPLVISALEHYKKGLKTLRHWQSYKAELKSLQRSLGTENAIFLNTCERLLEGVVGSTDLEKLLKEPFGQHWNSPEIKDQIALRLDHGFKSFKDTVIEMEAALRQVKAKLGLNEQGQVKWTEGKAIVREIKRATFTVQRSHFNALLTDISKYNQDLRTLTKQSIKLEPKRRIKYHGRLFSQLKEAVRSVYRAILNSLVCTCPGSHQVSLRLSKPKLIPSHEESQRIHESNFQCAVSFYADIQKPPRNDVTWTLMVIRSLEPSPETPETISPRMPAQRDYSTFSRTAAPPAIDTNRKRKKTQRVRFLTKRICISETNNSIYKIETTVASPTNTLFATPRSSLSGASVVQQHLEHPIDLCELVRKENSSQSSGFFGLLSNSDSQRYPKFGVYSQPDQEESTSMISLRTVLEDGGSNFPSISHADRLRLVVDISSGVLQIINTSWLPEQITSRDVMFPMRNGRPIYGQPFVPRQLLGTEHQPPVLAQAFHLKPLEKILISLGIVLSEILLGEILDHIWEPQIEESRSKIVDRLTFRKAARYLLSQVQICGSPNLYVAVRRFLLCEFTKLDLTSGDEAFCEEVYGKTIALLEEDFQHSGLD